MYDGRLLWLLALPKRWFCFNLHLLGTHNGIRSGEGGKDLIRCLALFRDNLRPLPSV
jgi:hypothetical protein